VSYLEHSQDSPDPSEMRKLFLEGASFIIFFLLLPFSVLADEINSKVIPDILFPGDVFLIHVESIKQPSGKFHGRTIQFYQVGDGIFQAILPTDMDTRPGSYEIEVNGEGIWKTYTLLIQEKEFPLQILTLPEDKVFLSPENLKRVEKENQRLSKIWEHITMPLWEGRFVPPLNDPVSTVFGATRIINGERKSIHRGIDYRGKIGNPVSTINSGRVVLRDDLFFGGKTVIINHGAGVYSIYMHLSQFNIKEGREVKKGDIIGLIGSSGRATGPHLHLGVKVHGVSVNPESLYSLPGFFQ